MSKVTIYGRQSCGFSGRAIELCQLHELDFEYIDIDKNTQDLSALQASSKTPITDMPQIFVGKKHVGGYVDFNSYLQKRSQAS